MKLNEYFNLTLAEARKLIFDFLWFLVFILKNHSLFYGKTVSYFPVILVLKILV